MWARVLHPFSSKSQIFYKKNLYSHVVLRIQLPIGASNCAVCIHALSSLLWVTYQLQSTPIQLLLAYRMLFLLTYICLHHTLAIEWFGQCVRNNRSHNSFPRPYSQEDNLNNLNTPQACIQKCRDRGHPFAGVQYSKECHCGKDPPSDLNILSGSDCNLPCLGNISQVCGGSFKANVYETQSK